MTTPPRVTVLPAGSIVIIVEPIDGVDDYAAQLQAAVEATAAKAEAARQKTEWAMPPVCGPVDDWQAAEARLKHVHGPIDGTRPSVVVRRAQKVIGWYAHITGGGWAYVLCDGTVSTTYGTAGQCYQTALDSHTKTLREQP